MKDRLWRLIGACETVTRNEAAALNGRDFASLNRLRDVKAELLADLAEEANLMHASCDSHARARLMQLLNCNKQNTQRLSEMKAETGKRLRRTRSANHQLHALRTAYTPEEGKGGKEFNVHG